ncbi:nitroreductase family protein [Erysipelothrix sp. HDW6C]|uniref:nitroreductase family protein n=1 Tax=Erysipelothrix sp. HDW6C TaxID=2714930 RepID=UPI0014075B70|nr:nitroreductase family protein [Erysipelothrix sp. HDW6C]QIK70217.1 nitroreductase family protein [Erysipelothrix sp. HDW6C]
MMNNNFDDVVLARRSIRGYDKNVKISQTDMMAILNDAARAPSSVNMQPWRTVVVESEAGKETLKPLIRFNGLQNDTSSAMIVIFGDMECYLNAETIYDQAVAEGKMSQEVRDAQLKAIVPYYKGFSRQKMNDVVKIDGSMFAMQLMHVARAHGYDTCPIGGFEEDVIAEALGLDAERYVPVVIVSIGKAVDKGYESVRLPMDTLTTFK